MSCYDIKHDYLLRLRCMDLFFFAASCFSISLTLAFFFAHDSSTFVFTANFCFFCGLLILSFTLLLFSLTSSASFFLLISSAFSLSLSLSLFCHFFLKFLPFLCSFMLEIVYIFLSTNFLLNLMIKIF